jgi:hypothetical protein
LVKALTRTIVKATWLLLLPVGCASILGIEDAELKDSDEAATGSGGSAGGAGDPSLCETYCETVMENCTEELAVYISIDQCLELCATIPDGRPGDDSGDSVHCRLNQANAAGETLEPADHCPSAGLGGANICGKNCDALCRAMLEFCPDEHASNAACLDDCESLTDLGGFNVTQSEGPTVQCRIWHIGAATQFVEPHCGHAAGASPCTTP